MSTTPPKYSTHWPPTHHLNVLSSLEPPLKTSGASFSGSSGNNGGGLSPPPSSLSSQSSAYSQLPSTTSAYSSSSSPSHHLPTHQTPTHHASYRDHSDSYRSHHHHSTISSQVRFLISNFSFITIIYFTVCKFSKHFISTIDFFNSFRLCWVMPQVLQRL